MIFNLAATIFLFAPMQAPKVKAGGPALCLNRCTSADIQTEGAQINRIAHRCHAANTQVRKLHLMFQSGHCCFDPGPPPIDLTECIAAFLKSPFLVFGPRRCVLKAGDLPVMFVGLHRTTRPVRAFPAYGKVETRLQFRFRGRG